MPMQKLCSGDWDRILQFSVYDWNKLVHTLLMCHVHVLACLQLTDNCDIYVYVYIHYDF